MRDLLLGEVVEVILGGTPKTTIPDYWDGEIYWITPGDIGDSKYIIRTEKTITQMGVDNSNTKILKPRDVVVSARGSVGKLVEIKEPMAFNQSCYALRTKNETQLLSGYIYYLLQSCVSYLRQNSAGAVFNAIIKTTLEGVPVKLPKLEVQGKISEALSAYDDLIENNRRRIQLLEESALLLYQAWFVYLRFPGHEQVKITDGVPEGWEPTLMPDVIDVNPRTPVEKGKEIWYVPMSSLSETGMTATTADFERRTKHTNVKFKKNDVLLACITPCLENGKTGYAYFLADNEVACGSTEFIILRGNRLPSEFVYCLVRSYPFRENAVKSMTGSSGRQRVQNSCFEKYRVPLPPSHILDEFVHIVQNNFDQIRNLMAQNAKLTQARDLLLPKLMSGELTV